MNMDPRRTIIGNRIDDRLALGMARTLLNRVAVQADKALDAVDRSLATSSARARRDSLLKVKSGMGPLFIGIVAKKNNWHALTARYAPVASREGKPFDGVAVVLEGIDLRARGTSGPTHHEHWPFHSPKVAALIEIHAIARIMQRSGTQDQAEVFRILRRVAAWSSIAAGREDPGSWMLPTENGLICARNSGPDAEKLDDWGGQPLVVVKTFIDRESFRIQTDGAWRRLVDCGALDAQPKMPSWDAPDPEHLRLWELMRDEGRGWDIRRAHALSVKPEADPEDGPEADPEDGVERIGPDAEPDEDCDPESAAP